MGGNISINLNQNKASLAILLSDKTDFKARGIDRNQKGYFIIIKESVYQQYITVKFVCTQQHSFIIYIENIARTRRNRQIHRQIGILFTSFYN